MPRTLEDQIAEQIQRGQGEKILRCLANALEAHCYDKKRTGHPEEADRLHQASIKTWEASKALNPDGTP